MQDARGISGRLVALVGGLAVVLLLVLPGLAACGGGGAGAVTTTGNEDLPPPPDPQPDPDPEPDPLPPAFENREAVRFVEIAEAAGIDFVFVYDATTAWTMGRPFNGGGAVGDFNRDGYEDLFVLGGGSQPDRLYMNDRDGTFTERAADWGVDHTHFGGGVAVGDYDGDGWLDLFVSSAGPPEEGPVVGRHRLYRNTGLGRFEEVAQAAGVDTTTTEIPSGKSASFGDIDLDGDLDLVVLGFTDPLGGAHLFRNEGDGTFTNVTDTALPPKPMHGFSVRVVDMNGDRYPELLIAADFETSGYFVNRTDGTFADRTVASGTGLDRNGMGNTVADLDGDGVLDWYVTSIQREPPDLPDGNRLYRGLGGDNYEEIATIAGVSDGAWGWGTEAVDVDHDGRPDLVEVNGWEVGPDQTYAGKPAYLFLNSYQGGYLDIASQAGFDHSGEGRGLIRFDLENDGDQDLVVLDNDGPLQLFRNDTATSNHWIRLRFDTRLDPGLAPDGYGTRVRLEAGGRSHHGVLHGSCTFLTQSELSLHFGLREATVVDELMVRWADGRVTTLEDVAVDRTHTIASPGP